MSVTPQALPNSIPVPQPKVTPQIQANEISQVSGDRIDATIFAIGSVSKALSHLGATLAPSFI